MAAGLIGRIALALQPGPKGIRGPSPGLLAKEIAALPALFAGRQPRMDIAPAAHPATVLLVPGFLTGPGLLRPLRRALKAAGHGCAEWGQGINLGLDQRNLDGLVARMAQLAERDGRPPALVGWSLGGLFAREAARRAPAHAARVITMGSPFSGNRHANNAWRLYHLVAGHDVDHPPGIASLAAKPPVRTLAIWSGRDGVVCPQSAAGQPGERDASVEVGCAHMHMPLDAATIRAVLAELDRSADRG